MSNYNDYLDVIVPIGVILPFAAVSMPVSFMECDGTPLDIDDYPQLHAILGGMYGYFWAGAGYPPAGQETHFRIPDYRDYFVRGSDILGVADPDFDSRTDRGDGTSGAFIGTKQIDDFDSHRHTYYYRFENGGSNTPPSKMDRKNNNSGNYVSRTLLSQSGGTVDTRPSNIRVVYAIRAI